MGEGGGGRKREEEVYFHMTGEVVRKRNECSDSGLGLPRVTRSRLAHGALGNGEVSHAYKIRLSATISLFLINMYAEVYFTKCCNKLK